MIAAVYMARFMHHCFVVDAGHSRAAWIPESHNTPGFSHGISGKAYLERLTAQAKQFNVKIHYGKVIKLETSGDGFKAYLADGLEVTAQKVILATGLVDKKPDLPNMPEFVYYGLIRFCPICDAYEAQGKTIGVLGFAHDIVGKAKFLRAYSANIKLLLRNAPHEIASDIWLELEACDIQIPNARTVDLIRRDQTVIALDEEGASTICDVVYPIMGAHVRSELALMLGAAHRDNGSVETNDHMMTSVEGLYAIGDLTNDLHQISVATGHAAIAACHAHNAIPAFFVK